MLIVTSAVKLILRAVSGWRLLAERFDVAQFRNYIFGA
jgi:hypothetical protein